jgi:hypothetical protein
MVISSDSDGSRADHAGRPAARPAQAAPTRTRRPARTRPARARAEARRAARQPPWRGAVGLAGHADLSRSGSAGPGPAPSAGCGSSLFPGEGALGMPLRACVRACARVGPSVLACARTHKPVLAHRLPSPGSPLDSLSLSRWARPHAGAVPACPTTPPRSAAPAPAGKPAAPTCPSRRRPCRRRPCCCCCRRCCPHRRRRRRSSSRLRRRRSRLRRRSHGHCGHQKNTVIRGAWAGRAGSGRARLD